MGYVIIERMCNNCLRGVRNLIINRQLLIWIMEIGISLMGLMMRN
jgi:hypothetical protein